MFDKKEHFKLKSKRELPEIKAVGYVYEHLGSGAVVYHLACDDENKVFCATFKTPPSDDTGVPHILEHCVLSGSRKYVAKDPFSQLMKGSLYTFLNAMTYPDKTLYPVASYNAKDFLNLMDVYCDAVFFPKVYDRKESFLQEGWSLKAVDAGAPQNLPKLEYNGIVYSEMKGSYSNPQSVLYDVVGKTLNPDTCYRYSSGGDPEAIPDLTYEQFLDFHRQFYAPENSCLYFYGDMDIDVCFEKLHNGYLSKFKKTGKEIVIAKQTPFTAPAFAEKPYAVVEGEEGDLNYLAAAYVLDRSAPELDYAVLYYLLMGTEASPLKKALKERGLGESIDGYCSVHCVMPEFQVIIQNSKYKAEFLKTQIEEILTELVKTGIDGEFFDAALNFFEFHYREQDFGTTPKGIAILTEQFAGHIYGEDPFDNLFWTKRLAQLRENGVGYFTEMTEKFLLKNNHSAFVTLVPDDKLNDKIEKAVEEKLEALKATLTQDDVAAITKEGEDLLNYQNTPDSDEVLAAIPMVEIGDLKQAAEKIPLEERDGVLYTNLDTNEIAYVNMWFDTRGIAKERLPKLNILMYLLCKLPTKKYSLERLTNELCNRTGGVKLDFNEFDAHGGYKPYVSVTTKTLRKNVEGALELCAEILTNTLFSDKERVIQLITEIKAEYDQDFISRGHNTAIMRAMSRVCEKWGYREHVKGIEFFRALEKLLAALEKDGAAFDALKAELESIAEELFTSNRLTVSVTLSDDMSAEFAAVVKKFKGGLPTAPYTPKCTVLEPCGTNEGFITSSKVQYNVITGNFTAAGYKYSGYSQVAAKILSDEYLLDRIRVKGGAYGYGAALRRGGEVFMFSYRDPKLKETYDVYNEAAAWLADFKADEREMTKFILGTTNLLDRPKTVRQKGVAAVTDLFNGVTYEMRQKERVEILAATPAAIREFSALINDCATGGVICTVGSAGSINANKDLFGKIEKL